eukprot:15474092-Alexandrium_andersonii.AAC.1
MRSASAKWTRAGEAALHQRNMIDAQRPRAQKRPLDIVGLVNIGEHKKPRFAGARAVFTANALFNLIWKLGGDVTLGRLPTGHGKSIGAVRRTRSPTSSQSVARRAVHGAW